MQPHGERNWPSSPRFLVCFIFSGSFLQGLFTAFPGPFTAFPRDSSAVHRLTTVHSSQQTCRECHTEWCAKTLHFTGLSSTCTLPHFRPRCWICGGRSSSWHYNMLNPFGCPGAQMNYNGDWVNDGSCTTHRQDTAFHWPFIAFSIALHRPSTAFHWRLGQRRKLCERPQAVMRPLL